MENDGCAIVRNCSERSQNKTANKRWGPLQLFLASVPLEFVAMNILVPLLMRVHDNKFIIGIGNREYKFEEDVLTSETTSSNVASL